MELSKGKGKRRGSKRQGLGMGARVCDYEPRGVGGGGERGGAGGP